VSLVLASAEQEVTVNAVQKIIGMLTDMSTKCKQEMKDEQVAFAEFEAFCANGKPALKKKIAKSAETIETLNAEIGKLTSDVANLGEEIAGLQADVTKFEADKKAHEAASEKDHKAFIEESTDYSESVDALDRAIQVLNEKDGNIAGASMLQLSMNDKRMPAKAKSLISAFLGLDDADQFEPPEANAYESQSGGIIEMLKKLKDEFRAKLGQCQKEEMNRAHAVNMVQQDLSDSIENANKDIEEKTAEKESKKEKIAEDKKELASTIEVKAADENLLEIWTWNVSRRSCLLMRNKSCALTRLRPSGRHLKSFLEMTCLAMPRSTLDLLKLLPHLRNSGQLREPRALTGKSVSSLPRRARGSTADV